MSMGCIWCGKPRDADDGEDEGDGLCLVCQLQLDTTGTLWTYRDPTLTAIVDDIHQRWPDRRGGP
jgi:CRISPR/Cas system-associated protein Cas10 (large subunit of type III CRISPR-Cas system)